MRLPRVWSAGWVNPSDAKEILGGHDGRSPAYVRDRVRPHRFCSESGLKPCELYRRGEPVFPASQPQGKKNDASGINLVVSDADFHEFPRQVEEATAFLQAHKEELARLRGFPGVEAMTLDFGIARRDVIVQSDFFPPSLIRLAGELGLGIELSQYPVDEE
jgi:hypothetical protein